MKALRCFFVFFVFALGAVGLSSCGEDDNELTRNAKGILLWSYEENGDVETSPLSLWINESSILFSMDADIIEVDWSLINEKEYIRYYPLTMNWVYDFINDTYGVNISSSTPYNEMPDHILNLIDKVKSLNSEYTYVASYYGTLLLMRRLNSDNYY